MSRTLLVLAIVWSPPLFGQAPFPPPQWTPIFQGVERADLAVASPRPLKGHALRIDLTAPGVEFLATPGNGDKAGHADALKTSSFLAKHRCQAAINAAPFGPVVNVEGQGLDIVGLHVSRGVVVAPEKNGYPALLLTKDNRATVAKPPFRLDGVFNAVGGFQIVLAKGKVLAGDRALHPRTAVGVAEDGKQMIWLVIDGRQKGGSEGVTTAEVGEWLKALGASDGINLDGGGTTTLALAGADGRPQVVNRPVHLGLPGTERPAASHLGVFARPLPGK